MEDLVPNQKLEHVDDVGVFLPSAIKSGCIETFEVIRRQNPDIVRMKSWWWHSCVHLAAAIKDPELAAAFINYLLDHDAVVQKSPDDGMPTLDIYARHPRVGRVLAERAGVPYDKRHLLQHAAENFNFTLIASVLAKGRQHINDVGEDPLRSWTALHAALSKMKHYYSPHEFMSFLLEEGADPTIQDSQGRNALQIARNTPLSDESQSVITLIEGEMAELAKIEQHVA